MAFSFTSFLGLGTPTPKKPRPTSTVGNSGVVSHGGYVSENERNSTLVGTSKYRVFDEMLLNRTIVSAGVRYFLNLVSQPTWKVEIPKDLDEGKKKRAEELAQKLRDSMNGMKTPWHKVVRRLAMHRFYGFAILEWTMERKDDGHFGFKDCEARPQGTIERWDLDDSGRLLGVAQRVPQTGEERYLPRGKTLYSVDDTLTTNPMGSGVLRAVVEACKRLQRYEELEGFGFETDLRGIPVVRAPLDKIREAEETGDLTSAEAASLVAPLRMFAQKHIKSPELGLLLDSAVYITEDERGVPSSIYKWDVELLKGGPAGLAEVAKAIERLNREIARVMGTEGLLLGDGERGSHALSEDKSHNFALIVESTLQELVETVEVDYRDPMWELNGWEEELKPNLKTESAKYRDIGKIVASLKDLAASSALVGRQDEAVGEIFDALGLTRPDPDDEGDELLLTGIDQMIQAAMSRRDGTKPNEPGAPVPPKKEEMV